MSPRLSSRVAAGALAVSALALFALTFPPWVAREALPRTPFRPAYALSTISGWELGGQIAAIVLLAVFTGLGAAALCASRPRDPLLPLVCGLAGAAAAAAAWRIWREIRTPSVNSYTSVQLGVRLALAAAIGLAVVAALASAQSLVGQRNRTPFLAAPKGSIWPAVAGMLALYVLAIVIIAWDFWSTDARILCCAGAALGYAVPRWWVALVPLPVGVALFQLTGPDGSLWAFAYGLMAVFVVVAIAIGIATRDLQRRQSIQQQV